MNVRIDLELADEHEGEAGGGRRAERRVVQRFERRRAGRVDLVERLERRRTQHGRVDAAADREPRGLWPRKTRRRAQREKREGERRKNREKGEWRGLRKKRWERKRMERMERMERMKRIERKRWERDEREATPTRVRRLESRPDARPTAALDDDGRGSVSEPT